MKLMTRRVFAGFDDYRAQRAGATIFIWKRWIKKFRVRFAN